MKVFLQLYPGTTVDLNLQNLQLLRTKFSTAVFFKIQYTAVAQHLAYVLQLC